MNFLVGALAFFSEFLDSSMGMGYGTALVPMMLFLGYDPLKVIPAVLISQLATDIVTMTLHHKAKNVDLKIGSQDFKVAMILGGGSAVLGSLPRSWWRSRSPKTFSPSISGRLFFSWVFLCSGQRHGRCFFLGRN